jgi:hypothetical protein
LVIFEVLVVFGLVQRLLDQKHALGFFGQRGGGLGIEAADFGLIDGLGAGVATLIHVRPQRVQRTRRSGHGHHAPEPRAFEQAQNHGDHDATS